MIIAFVIALAINGFAYWFSDKMVLAMYHAHAVTAEQAPRLHAIVRTLAERANLPMPKVYVIDSPNPNAFATGRNPKHAAVAVTTGILKLLTEDQLSGVIGHELAHVEHRDILIATVAATIAGTISFLATMARWSLIFGGGGRGRNRGNPIALLVIAIVAPLVALFIQLWISRTREYAADARGAQLAAESPPARARPAAARTWRGTRPGGSQPGHGAHVHRLAVQREDDRHMVQHAPADRGPRRASREDGRSTRNSLKSERTCRTRRRPNSIFRILHFLLLLLTFCLPLAAFADAGYVSVPDLAQRARLAVQGHDRRRGPRRQAHGQRPQSRPLRRRAEHHDQRRLRRAGASRALERRRPGGAGGSRRPDHRQNGTARRDRTAVETPAPRVEAAWTLSGARKVVIDPGHGGDDTGTPARFGNLDEKEIALEVALAVGAHLRSQGVTVLFTRTTDVRPSLEERADLANRENPDLFISIHVNADARKELRGATAYYPAAGALGSHPGHPGPRPGRRRGP